MFVRQEGDLNGEQEKAINEPNNVFLVACPGSGKTKTLTYKIAQELSILDNPKKRIIAITYTHRAADEILDRIERTGVSTNQLWIGTIHAFCLEWIIKPYGIYHDRLKMGYRIINSYDTEAILTSLCARYTNQRPTHYDCDHFFDSNGLNIKCNNGKRRNVEAVISEYHAVLERNRQIDFELMLWFSYQLIKQHPTICKTLSNIFSYILIDEYQDTKEIQYQIFSAILRVGNGCVKAFIVGDPNQSIFTSLGGYPIPRSELERISQMNFVPMQLSKNYRSSERLVNYFSNFKVFDSAIVSEGEFRNYPSLVSFNRQTSRDNLIQEIARLIRLNIEQHGISPNEICIVGPWWVHLATLTRGLVSILPEYKFDGPGLTPFARDIDNFFYKLARIILTRPSPDSYVKRIRWAKEIIENLSSLGIDVTSLSPKLLLKIINQTTIAEQDGLSFLGQYFDAIFNYLNINYLGYKSLQDHRDAFFQSSRDRITRIRSEGVSYIGDVETFYKAFEPREGITVSTIHGIKGAEFDSVIAFALLDGAVPYFSDPDPVDSANKLLYVISSRARKNLHIISETGRNQTQPTPALVKLNFGYDTV